MIRVLLDANIIYQQYPRDVLMHLGLAEVVRLHWTEEILDEAFNNLFEKKPEKAENLERTRRLMSLHQPLASVSGYEHLIEQVEIRDPNDRHVLAAAIHSEVDAIITEDKDFTRKACEPWGIDVMTSDMLVNELLDQVAPGVMYALDELSKTKRNKRWQEWPYLLEKLGARHFPTSMARLRRELGL